MEFSEIFLEYKEIAELLNKLIGNKNNLISTLSIVQAIEIFLIISKAFVKEKKEEWAHSAWKWALKIISATAITKNTNKIQEKFISELGFSYVEQSNAILSELCYSIDFILENQLFSETTEKKMIFEETENFIILFNYFYSKRSEYQFSLDHLIKILNNFVKKSFAILKNEKKIEKNQLHFINSLISSEFYPDLLSDDSLVSIWSFSLSSFQVFVKSFFLSFYLIYLSIFFTSKGFVSHRKLFGRKWG